MPRSGTLYCDDQFLNCGTDFYLFRLLFSILHLNDALFPGFSEQDLDFKFLSSELKV